MERTLVVMQEASDALDLSTPPPCDSTGTPTDAS